MYDLTPIREGFGAFVTGIDLKTVELSGELVEKIKEDMKEWRVLVFRGQGEVAGERQVAISEQLGEVVSTFYKHPSSPHPDVFRVSNNSGEGCTNVGRSGWHVDGTFQDSPFKYQTMHFHRVCEGGETWFVPLKELYEIQDKATRKRWDRYWFFTGRKIVHPLVYDHPLRGDATMLFHCGPTFCIGWGVDDHNPNTAARSIHRLLPSDIVQEELTAACDNAVDLIGIKMKWEQGDFAINDNLGNAHYAAPGTQNCPRKSGLRVLHRTTIAGDVTPMKSDGRASFIHMSEKHR